MSPNDQNQPERALLKNTHLNKKYRPQSFDATELVGQEHIVRTLRNAVRTNRIAPAYLFCGPRGTGKTSTARILAKAANCLDPNPDKRPCNQCTSCTAINQGATPDVIEIDAASNRGIDDIRDLRDKVKYAPTQLRYKFYIIDEAHQITGAAANAFLKTLEDPPDHTRFILATTDPEELLPTIVSRCQRFDFRRHAPETIANRIKALAAREEINLADDALALIAELAHGSMRDPIGLLEQLSNFHAGAGPGGEPLTADNIRELVGISRSEVAVSVLVSVSQHDSTAALSAINEAVLAGQDPRQLNRQIVSLIRDGLYAVSGVLTIDEQPELRAAYDRLSLKGLLRIANAFADTDTAIRSAVIPQLPLEMSVLEAILGSEQAAQPPAATAVVAHPTRPIDRPPAAREVARPENGESTQRSSAERTDNASSATAPRTTFTDMVRKPAPGKSAQDAPQIATDQSITDPTSNDAGSANVTIEFLVDLWPKIRADIKSLDRRTEALLMEVDPVEISDSEIVLAAAYEFHRDKLNEEERRAIVESVISRRIGRTVRAQCVLRSDFAMTVRTRSTPATPEPPARVEPVVVESAPAESDRADEKMLGAVVRMFDGEIIED